MAADVKPMTKTAPSAARGYTYPATDICPKGQPYGWDAIRAELIDSANRKESPWIKPAKGVKHPRVLLTPEEAPAIRERLKKGAGPRTPHTNVAGTTLCCFRSM